MKVVLIRHGPTAWNAEKRVQGRIDQPLSADGVKQVCKRAMPTALQSLQWYSSPLLRARQTAELMGIKSPLIESALTEMSWGDWEGEILKPLRKKLGDEMRNNEAKGLDFCPPNGESPRQVQSRIQHWLNKIIIENRDTGAFVHKGIIRCIYAMAFDWDMRGESPIAFNWEHAHTFELDPRGRLKDLHSSISLTAER